MDISISKTFWMSGIGLLLALIGPQGAAAQHRVQQARLQQLARTLHTQERTEHTTAVQRAQSLGLPVRQTLASGATVELRRFERDTPVYTITHNATAAQTTSAAAVWPGAGQDFSLTGAGVTIGIWDAKGVRLEHQEFGDRVSQIDGLQSNANHSTHVAGTMAAGGVDPGARGMAYEAQLDAYNWTFDASEMADAAASGLPLSNHSYGEAVGWINGLFGDGLWVWMGDPAVDLTEDYRFGFYNTTAQQWDEISYEAPHYLIVKAAGNDRSDEAPNGATYWHRDPDTRVWVQTTGDLHERDGGPDGYDTIIDAGVAKNVLTVGAVGDVPGGYAAPGDVAMTAFSNWGPTDDGRIKPDVVANGTGVYSPIASSNTAYGTSSGTSMAAANATGSIALLLEHQQHLHGATPLRAATLKALIIHTADEAGPAPGPDYQHGWGLINTLEAARVMAQNAEVEGSFHMRELTLQSGETLTMEVWSDGSAPVQVTLAWTDPAGTASAIALDPTTPRLVNDLDLRVLDPGGQQVAPWVLDPAVPSAPATTGDNTRDNVEQVVVAAPSPGRYTVQITHKGTLTDGAQPVSLILTGASPLDAARYPLSLSPGWNFISGLVTPDAPELDAVFSDIQSDILLVKDQQGQIYSPSFGINSIGDWDPTSAYMVYAEADATLTLEGEAITPETTSIALVPGWNFVPYLRDVPLPVDEALAPIADQLVMVKDSGGQVYVPEFGIDTMGTMQPGRGYKVYVDEAATLNYP